MDLPQLFNSLSANQIKLSIDGDEIVVNGSSKLTPEQKQGIKTNKPAILSMLTSATESVAEPAADDPEPEPNQISAVSKVDCERFKQAFIAALHTCRDHEQMETVLDDLKDVARGIVAYRNIRSWEITYQNPWGKDTTTQTAPPAEDPFAVVAQAEAVEGSV